MNTTEPTPAPTGKTFPLGRLRITPGAQAALDDAGIDPADLLARHAVGDWGIVCADDWEANDDAVREGDRIFSAYPLDPTTPHNGKVWIITEADRSMTTILRPDEY